MSGFKKYQELDIWQKAFNLSLMIFDLCKKLPRHEVNRVLIHQIIRSVSSIAGNIAEGSGASSRKDFINYLHYARKSAIETDNWLTFVFTTNRIADKSKKMLFEKTSEVIKILTTIIKKAKSG